MSPFATLKNSIMETPFNVFKEYTSRFVQFLPEELAFYEQKVEYLEIPRKGVILNEGEIENYLYFILDGVTRVYFNGHKREVCVDFGFANQFICSFISYKTNKPSALTIQAITPVKLLRIHKSDVEELNATSINSERLGRIAMEILYANKLKREMSLLSLSAEENYLLLIDKHPEVAQNVPVKDLATYLGIHPESLSRIRKKIHRTNL
jgi:CRP-like cAMP-binding protein